MASLLLRSYPDIKFFMSLYMGVNKKNDPFHRWMYGRVDGVFTSSSDLKAKLPSLYPIPAVKVHLLPYGRRPERYVRDQARRTAIRARLGVGDDEFFVGTMVRIDPGKGALDFARSISYLPDHILGRTKYLIVGEPTRRGKRKVGDSLYEPHCVEYLGEIEAFIRHQNLSKKILLAGFQEDEIGYLSAMDAFVFPSRDELFSLVVLDAMCMGLPIVAAGAGGTLLQIRDDQNGLLYRVGDSSDLARKIVRYSEDPPLRNRHGAAARAFVCSEHSMESTISRLLGFYAGQTEKGQTS